MPVDDWLNRVSQRVPAISARQPYAISGSRRVRVFLVPEDSPTIAILTLWDSILSSGCLNSYSSSLLKLTPPSSGKFGRRKEY